MPLSFYLSNRIPEAEPGKEGQRRVQGSASDPCGIDGQMKKCGHRGQTTPSGLGGNEPAAIWPSIRSVLERRLPSFLGVIVTGSAVSSVK